ncbi:MAG: hypothetical protein WCA63_03895, partial [Gallionella sp.]
IAAFRQKRTKSSRIKIPLARGLKQGERLPDSAPPSLTSAASRADSRPPHKLSLLLSLTLSIPGNTPTQPGIPTMASGAPEVESVAKAGKLSELYAQIAETEKMIKAQQRQLDIMDSPLNSGIADSGPAAMSSAASNVPDIVNEQSEPKPVFTDIQSTSNGLLRQAESLEMSWIDLATGLAVLSFTALVLFWYRKIRTGHPGQLIVPGAHQDNGSKRILAIAKTSAPNIEQTIKTPAYAEQKTQSIFSPEYEMLEEADIYLRFGHDKLAEEAMSEAIKINPSNPQAYLALLRLYLSRKDSAAFLALARQLKSLGDDNILAKVTEMGRNLDPANTLYS